MKRLLTLLVVSAVSLAGVGRAIAADAADNLKIGDVVVTTKAGVKLMVGNSAVAEMAVGASLKVTALNGEWAGVSTMNTAAPTTGWVKRTDITAAAAGGAVANAKGVDPKSPDGWKTWAAEENVIVSAAADAPPLSADFYPLKPGTEYQPVQGYFENGKPTQVTFKIMKHTAEGIISKTDKVVLAPDNMILGSEFFPPVTLKYEVKDGYLRIGWPPPKDKDGKPAPAGTPMTWNQEIKVGAKVGDRWNGTADGKDAEKNYKEYLAGGTYKGKRCAVIGRTGSYSVFVEGLGPVLTRTYEQKDGTWLISFKENWEAAER